MTISLLIVIKLLFILYDPPQGQEKFLFAVAVSGDQMGAALFGAAVTTTGTILMV